MYSVTVPVILDASAEGHGVSDRRYLKIATETEILIFHVMIYKTPYLSFD